MSAPAVVPPHHRAARPVIAVVGNPNTGKSTLFNALTGLRQRVANFPGVTVEHHVGVLELGDQRVDLVDLPGAYSLAARAPDEAVAVDVLSGRIAGIDAPRAVLVLADATNLRRTLFLASQVRDLGLPTVVAVTMGDLAAKRGIELDLAELGRRLEVPTVAVVAPEGRGLAELRAALARALNEPAAPAPNLLPEVRTAASALAAELGVSPAVVERALLDGEGESSRRLTEDRGPVLAGRLAERRHELGGGRPLAMLEATRRYGWIDRLLAGVETRHPVVTTADRVDRVLGRPAVGLVLFGLIMTAVFQAVFTIATPLAELIDAGVGAVGALAAQLLPDGLVESLVVDGAIAGVGSVLVFLPQILILFALIIALEDSGYMARAAFLVDRLMRACGLSGHSFIPMLSSFACAVPGIMATRVIRDRRDRLATIFAAPFMTCSARLPVYALLIAAFVPAKPVLGPVLDLRGVALLGLYLLGAGAGILAALSLKRTVLRGPTPPFLLEMPPYRWPTPRALALRLWERGREFVVRAGTVILAASLVVWALATFPRGEELRASFAAQRAVAEAGLAGEARDVRLAELDADERAALLEQTLLGRAGHLLEPVFRPLGWDWRLSAAVVASFPAREVVIAAMGTIFAVGSSDVEAGLAERLVAARALSGAPLLGVPEALGLLVFFALCLQCVSTLAVMRRETGGWTRPVVAWISMTALAWLGAWLTVSAARWWLGPV